MQYTLNMKYRNEYKSKVPAFSQKETATPKSKAAVSQWQVNLSAIPQLFSFTVVRQLLIFKG